MMDDFYYYMAVGDLALPSKNFFADKPTPSHKEQKEEPK